MSAIQARDDLSDRAVEEAADLPPAFLNKARAGKNRNHRAASSIAKLVRWISTKGGAPARGVAPPQAPAPSSPEPARREVDPAAVELVAQINGAMTQRKLGRLMTRVLSDFAAGAIDGDAFEVYEKGIARRSKILKDERDEKAVAQVRALEILTPDEVRVLREYRAQLSGPPMKPGEAAPPPTGVAT